MKVLITGADGQLGTELQKSAPGIYKIFAHDVLTLDITDKKQLNEYINEIAPHCIINAAAYTAVDKAEEEKDQAFKINAEGVANIAEAAASNNARLIHVSTDFVFDGNAGRPYKPDDKPNPVGVYGTSKYEGEIYINKIHKNSIIIRTAWLYSSHGKNFVKTMLDLMKDRSELKIVSDQIGSPTWANGLASFLWNVVKIPDVTGTYHWTDAGVASWFDFAVAIMEEALDLKMLDKIISIIPVTTENFPTPARRPQFSVLDKSTTWGLMGKSAPHWRVSLRRMLEEYSS